MTTVELKLLLRAGVGVFQQASEELTRRAVRKLSLHPKQVLELKEKLALTLFRVVNLSQLVPEAVR